ncbi:MAG: hypothetical protein ACREI8_04905, partial [Myxococcota bacterium]
GSRTTAAFVLDVALGVDVNGGSARVLATASRTASPGILCSAVLHDRLSLPASSMVDLPVIRKTTQQGD